MCLMIVNGVLGRLKMRGKCVGEKDDKIAIVVFVAC
jgi:hypothetical protein